MKKCIECRHFQVSLDPSQCAAPGNREPDFVNGGVRPIYQTAQAIRCESDMCGTDAAWFAPRIDEKAAA